MKSGFCGWPWAVVSLLAGIVGGCGAEAPTGEGEPVEDVQHPILNGTPIPEANSGVVRLSVGAAAPCCETAGS